MPRTGVNQIAATVKRHKSPPETSETPTSEMTERSLKDKGIIYSAAILLHVKVEHHDKLLDLFNAVAI